MRADPKGRRSFCLELFFDRKRGLAGGEPGPVSDPENVCVDRKCFGAERAIHDDIGCLATHTWQLFKRIAIRRDLSAMFSDKNFRQGDHILGLGVEQADRLYVLLEAVHAERHHLRWCFHNLEQEPCRLVDPDVRRLRREHDSHKQLIIVAEVQFRFRETGWLPRAYEKIRKCLPSSLGRRQIPITWSMV